jgi:hypothetical protein
VGVRKAWESQYHYVIMASCAKRGIPERKGYDRLLKRAAPEMTGRFLNMWDSKDVGWASCKELRANNAAIELTEQTLSTGKGHGAFYSPSDVWLKEIRGWMR